MTRRERYEEGGSAFPGGHGTQDGPEAGMTLRDYFAASALQGLLASHAHPNGSLPRPGTDPELAQYAYGFADLMLAHRQLPQRES